MMEGVVMVEPGKNLFDGVVPRLRKVANATSDLGLSLRALAVVAGVTKTISDIRLALEKAERVGSCYERAKPLAVLTKILAETRDFPLARQTATGLSGIDTFQCAIARIWIARFSGDEDDTMAMEVAIKNIRAGHATVAAIHDRDMLLLRSHHRTGTSDARFYEHLMVLARALADLKSFEEDAHRVRPGHTSAHFYNLAESAIDWFFAEIMDR